MRQADEFFQRGNLALLSIDHGLLLRTMPAFLEAANGPQARLDLSWMFFRDQRHFLHHSLFEIKLRKCALEPFVEFPVLRLEVLGGLCLGDLAYSRSTCSSSARTETMSLRNALT